MNLLIEKIMGKINNIVRCCSNVKKNIKELQGRCEIQYFKEHTKIIAIEFSHLIVISI